MRISIQKNGPYRLEGDDIELCDAGGQQYGLGERKVVLLCRCGHSAAMPFCDGSHRREGFRDEPKARDLPPLP